MGEARLAARYAMDLILAVSLTFVLGMACGILIARRPGMRLWEGTGRYIPPEVRAWVIDISKRSCIYCGRVGDEDDPDGYEWEIDHVIPISKGGPHAVSNFALSCRRCNRAKTDGLPPLPFTRRVKSWTSKS